MLKTDPDRGAFKGLSGCNIMVSLSQPVRNSSVYYYHYHYYYLPSVAYDAEE